MMSALFKAVNQLPDPAFRRVLSWTLLLTLIAFLALALASREAWGYMPEFEAAWLNLLVDFAGGLGFLFVTWFLFPGVATAIMGLFLDDAAAAVEAKHYSADVPGTALGMARAGMEATKLGAVILAANLAALPVYLIFLPLPPVPAILYYGLNGYLLGREYFELVAMRHRTPAAAHAMRRRFSGTLTLHGLVIAVAFSIPLVNLLAPLFGTAYMTHVYKMLAAEKTAVRP